MKGDKLRNGTSVAYETSRVLGNGGPVTVYGASGYNSGAAASFVQFHDAAALPAEGAVPGPIVNVPATSNWSIDFGIYGRTFQNGCVIVNSSTGPTKTIKAAELWIDAQFD